MHILYDECSEDVTGKYCFEKYQWRKWGATLGAIAPLLREKFPLLKEYKKEVIHLVFPHFNFWSAIEKYYYVFILMGCESNS